MDTAAERKDDLRKRMKALRSGIPAAERQAADAAICERVCSLSQFEEADVVLSYLSFGAETDTRRIIDRAWQAGKAVALPRCVGPREMRWFRVDDLGGLETSPFGVDEPRIDEAAEQLLSTGERMVAIVPALAFDGQGYRLGYGGGFYDTFLASFQGVSIGLCRNAQRLESLRDEGAIGEFDLPVDLVVSENSG